MINCVICGKKLNGYGNNAEPVKMGLCCDDCNIKVVVPQRLKQLYAEKERSKEDERRQKLTGTRR